jgi:hypothetical protein
VRKVFYTTLLLLGLMLSGCNGEKQQIETYMEQLKSSNDAMKAIVSDMQTSMGVMQKEIRAGKFDTAKIKANIEEFENKMKAQKARLEGVSVPEKARALQDSTIKQYELFISVVDKTPGMVDIAKRLSDAVKRGKDPKQKKAALEEMKAANAEMRQAQMEVRKLAKEGNKLNQAAIAEKDKLVKEFGLKDESPTPAPANAGRGAARPGMAGPGVGGPGAPGQGARLLRPGARTRANGAPTGKGAGATATGAGAGASSSPAVLRHPGGGSATPAAGATPSQP